MPTMPEKLLFIPFTHIAPNECNNLKGTVTSKCIALKYMQYFECSNLCD